MKINNKAFTFVELIIVVVILSILSIIGFFSYSSFFVDSRDAGRMEALLDIKKTIELYRIKSFLPIPDRKVDIMVDGLTTSYQGYLSEDILNNIDYLATGSNRGKDPKDKVFYTYLLASDYKRFELMGYLESQNESQVHYITSTYAEGIDYKDRYPVFYGDFIGVLTESGTNTPLQEIPNIKLQGYINFTGSLTGSYNLNIKNTEKYSSDDMIFIGNKIKEVLKIH
nr:prepilin-type N-terminal cleavage/methylation domain-containing protein [Candidatus Gracilibacteria bacterium]